MVYFYPDRETVFFLPNLSISFCGVLTHFLRARALSREGRAGHQFLYNNPSDPQRLLLNLPSAASYLTKSFLPFSPFSPRIVSPFCAALFRAPLSSLSDQEPRKPRGQPKLRGHCWLRDEDKGQRVCGGLSHDTFCCPWVSSAQPRLLSLLLPGKRRKMFSPPGDSLGSQLLSLSSPFRLCPSTLTTAIQHPPLGSGAQEKTPWTTDTDRQQPQATTAHIGHELLADCISVLQTTQLSPFYPRRL